MILFLLACGAPVESAAAETEAPVCGDSATGAGEDPLNLTGNVGCGVKLFQQTGCVDCHGPDGLGTDAGPSLLEHVHCHTDPQLLVVLTGGRPKMPDQHLGPQQLADVLGWLREAYGAYTGPDDPVCPEFTP